MISEYMTGLGFSQKYDIMGAIRGPDIEKRSTLTLKALITQRIRHIAFEGVMAGGVSYVTVPNPIGEYDLANIEEAIREAKAQVTGADHYLGHLASAVRSSLDHPTWGGHGDKIASALEG